MKKFRTEGRKRIYQIFYFIFSVQLHCLQIRPGNLLCGLWQKQQRDGDQPCDGSPPLLGGQGTTLSRRVNTTIYLGGYLPIPDSSHTFITDFGRYQQDANWVSSSDEQRDYLHVGSDSVWKNDLQAQHNDFWWGGSISWRRCVDWISWWHDI